MAAKPIKKIAAKKDAPKKAAEAKKSSLAKPLTERDTVEEEEPMTKAVKVSSAKSKTLNDDDDDIADVTVPEDSWDKPEKGGDENWDPDFDEFDLPKSSIKKAGKKAPKEDDDDFGVDEEFKDMFGSSSSSSRKNNDDDDDY